ncbi:MAG TPA: cobalt-precorrin-6A reductase [Propionibacteriaceae bacterium]|nr:cobalt-precorrin-6A reductase [Propionibacteriaceae bacterium]
MTVVILGGTAEARQLAGALVADGVDVVSSLAGRVGSPSLPSGRVRLGGFGGVNGLAEYLLDQRTMALVDATHPFAATISRNAVQAASLTDTPLARLERPGWGKHPRAESWTWVPDTAAASVAADLARRPFLTTGRQTLTSFASWADRDVLIRLVDPPMTRLPARWTVILSRGPYSYCGERQILSEHAIDVLLTKDSGGAHTVAKLDAAGDLGIPVVIIARPELPPVRMLRTVAEAAAWCKWNDLGDACASRGSRS